MNVVWCTRDGMRASYNCLVAHHPIVTHQMDDKWDKVPVVNPGVVADERIRRNRADLGIFLQNASLFWMLEIAVVAAVSEPQDSGDMFLLLQISFVGLIVGLLIAYGVWRSLRGVLWR